MSPFNKKTWSKEYVHKPETKERQKLNKKNYHNKRKDFILTYKKDKSCSMCGWNEHPEILQFHHVKEKTKMINRMMTSDNINKIMEEIKKCVLLCPNCHYWFHYTNKNQKTKPFTSTTLQRFL